MHFKETSFTPPTGLRRKIHEKLEFINTFFNKVSRANLERDMKNGVYGNDPIDMVNFADSVIDNFSNRNFIDNLSDAVTISGNVDNQLPSLISTKLESQSNISSCFSRDGETLVMDLIVNPEESKSVKSLATLVNSVIKVSSPNSYTAPRLRLFNGTYPTPKVVVKFDNDDLAWKAITSTNQELDLSILSRDNDDSYHELVGSLR